MATHNLFHGGAGRAIPTYLHEQFPSIEVGLREEWAPDELRAGSTYTLCRYLDWGCAPRPNCSSPNGQGRGSRALQQYLRNNPIVVGDELNIIGIPRHMLLRGVYHEVVAGGAGFTFTLRVRGAAGTSVPAPVTIATVNGATPVMGWTNLATPLFFDHNDMIQMTLTGLPAPSSAPCGGCENQPISQTFVKVCLLMDRVIDGDVHSGLQNP